MLQSLSCIRMGEVLFDENLQLFILCNNCHTDLRNLQDFRQHLEKCEGLENLFQQGRKQLKYNTDKCTQLFGKTVKGIKEFLIYDYNDVDVTSTKPEENFIDLINIEEELLDPKWYSDLNVDVCKISPQKSSKQYDELVEAVTPFVQFKENLKSNSNGRNKAKSNLVKSATDLKVNIKETEKTLKTVKFDLTANKERPTAKRKLYMSKTEPAHFGITTPAEINAGTNLLNTIPTPQVPMAHASKRLKSDHITNGFIKPAAVNTPKNNHILPHTTVPTNIVLNSVSRKPSAVPITIVKQEPTKEKQTAQILSKLQNLGLQVKRTQPLPKPVSANSSTQKTDTKTLEILQRLQSKGMKVKILNKGQIPETNINFPIVNSQGFTSGLAQKTSVIRRPAANVTINKSLNKNLIIKKVN